MNILRSLFSRRAGPDKPGLLFEAPDGPLAPDQAGRAENDVRGTASDVAETPMPLPPEADQGVATYSSPISAPPIAAEPILPGAQVAIATAAWIPRHTPDRDTTYTIPSVQPATEPSAPADIATLLADFETLGDNPEFGLLREALGAPPDGLFGFGTMYPNALITLLRNRFTGLVEVENLSARIAWGRYYVDEKTLGLSWRTDVKDGEMDVAAVLIREADRLARLRAQLMAHLASDLRLFVYAGPASNDRISAMRAAMRQYGSNTLLHVVAATGDGPCGQVTLQQDGLLRGTIGRYGNASGRWDIATGDWIAVCRAAHRLWRPNGSAAI